jgi:hypothetical protein
MTSLVVLVLLIECSAFAGQEFYRADVLYYVQPNASEKQRPGLISFPAGTYQRVGAGTLDEIALRITDTEVQILLPQDKETLTAEKKQSFLSGEMVTLGSGRRVQFFRPVEKLLHCLLIYSPRGGLQEAVDLIEKKT